MVPTVTNVPPKPGKADTLKPIDGLAEREQVTDGDVNGSGNFVKSQQEMLSDSLYTPLLDNRGSEGLGNPFHRNDDFKKVDNAQQDGGVIQKEISKEDIDNWQPKPPKVLMENPNAVPLELRSQIQMYATTE